MSFPRDLVMENGAPFWSSPKRCPVPVVFDAADELHMLFVRSTALLLAEEHRVPVPEVRVRYNSENLMHGSYERVFTSMTAQDSDIAGLLAHVVVPPFVPKSKKIVTDESVKRADAVKVATHINTNSHTCTHYTSLHTESSHTTPLSPLMHRQWIWRTRASRWRPCARRWASLR